MPGTVCRALLFIRACAYRSLLRRQNVRFPNIYATSGGGSFLRSQGAILGVFSADIQQQGDIRAFYSYKKILKVSIKCDCGPLVY